MSPSHHLLHMCIKPSRQTNLSLEIEVSQVLSAILPDFSSPHQKYLQHAGQVVQMWGAICAAFAGRM
eukprot:1047305-Amphidinium_carterae.1